MTLPLLSTDRLLHMLTLAQTGADGEGEARGMTLLEQIHNGGVTGYVIIVLSVVAVSLMVIHLIAIRPDRLMPPHLVAQLTDVLSRRDVSAAISVCSNPENDCFLTRVLRQGLARYQRSAFGPFEFKDALEEAGNEQVARMYRATDALGLIGAIAPMLGLLGTVIGITGAFNQIAVDFRQELLAGDISKALITTMMGLCLAIPTMAAFTFLRNRIDTYAAEAAQAIEEMTLPLEPSGTAPHGSPEAARATPGAAGPARPAGAAAPARPAAPRPTTAGQTSSPPAPAGAGQPRNGGNAG